MSLFMLKKIKSISHSLIENIDKLRKRMTLNNSIMN